MTGYIWAILSRNYIENPIRCSKIFEKLYQVSMKDLIKRIKTIIATKSLAKLFSFTKELISPGA